MLRAYLAIGLVIAVIGITIFNSGDKPWIGGGEASANARCDVLEETCTWSTREGQWSAQLSAGESTEQGVEYHFQLTSPVEPERYLAVLRGQSMYMGEYPVPLKSDAEGEYSATFTAPFCATGTDMIWRIDLQSGERKLDVNDRAMVFNAVE